LEQLKVGGETQSYCTSCREMRLHNIVAMVGAVPARVECRSCHKQHNYKAAPPGTARKKAAEGGAEPKRPRAKAAPKEARAVAGEHPLDALLQVRPASEARTYVPSERYVVGDLLSHPSFGLGAVSALPAPGKIEVIFRDASRLLLHERPTTGAQSGPKLQPPPRRDDSRSMGASDAPPKR
jgi:hypothetical protein